MSANRRWWQYLIPTHGNWGGPGYSAGIWNNDPAKTDWGVEAADRMDQAFKEHDWVYQTGGNIAMADAILVARLHQIPVSGRRSKAYRVGAIFVFSLRVWWFMLTGKFSEIPRFSIREHGYKQE